MIDASARCDLVSVQFIRISRAGFKAAATRSRSMWVQLAQPILAQLSPTVFAIERQLVWKHVKAGEVCSIVLYQWPADKIAGFIAAFELYS